MDYGNITIAYMKTSFSFFIFNFSLVSHIVSYTIYIFVFFQGI